MLNILPSYTKFDICKEKKKKADTSLSYCLNFIRILSETIFIKEILFDLLCFYLIFITLFLEKDNCEQSNNNFIFMWLMKKTDSIEETCHHYKKQKLCPINH